jgi:hypothetical protein
VKIRPADRETATELLLKQELEEQAPLPAHMALEALRDAFSDAEAERIDAEYAELEDEDDDEPTLSQRLQADAYVSRRR